MAVLLAVGLTWRIVRWAMGFPFWGDEAFVVMNLMERGLADLAAPLSYNQVAPPGWLWLEKAAALAWGIGERVLRLAPLAAGCAALLGLARLAGRMLDRRAALLAVGILAVSYFPVRYSTEVKPYSFDLLLSVALLSVGWSLLRRRGGRWLWVVWLALSGGCVWVSFPSVFVAGGVGLVLIADAAHRRRWRAVAVAALAGVLLAVSLASVLRLSGPTAGTQQAMEAHWDEAFPPTDRPWLLPWWLLKVHTGRTMAYPIGDRNGASALTFVCVVAGVVSLWRRRRRGLLAVLLAPLALTLVAAALRRYPYGLHSRISQHMAPVFCLLAGAGGAALVRGIFRTPRRRAVALGVWACALAAVAAVGIVRDVGWPYKVRGDQDIRAALTRWGSESTPGADQWLVFGPGGAGSPGKYFVPSRHMPTFLLEARRRHPGHMVPGPWPQPLPRAAGRTWVVVMRDETFVSFPQATLAKQLSALTARLGPPRRHKAALHLLHGTGTLEAYEFPAPATASPASAP